MMHRTFPNQVRERESESERCSLCFLFMLCLCKHRRLWTCVDIAFGFGRNFLQCLALFRRSRTLGQKLWRRRPAADFCFVHRKKEARETERSQWKISAILANCFDRYVSARVCVTICAKLQCRLAICVGVGAKLLLFLCFAGCLPRRGTQI